MRVKSHVYSCIIVKGCNTLNIKTPFSYHKERSVVLYGCKAWALMKSDEKISTQHRWVLLATVGDKLQRKVNKNIMKELNTSVQFGPINLLKKTQMYRIHHKK